MNTKEFESKKGITLVALVVSILVLLILAGVTLQLAVGEDGIIGGAIVAREQHEDAEEMELIELAVSAAMVDGQGELTTENLNKELREQFTQNTNLFSIPLGWIYRNFRIYKENGKVEKLPIHCVKYVESTGTQWIDTGVKSNSNLNLTINFEALSNNDNSIFGSRTSDVYNQILLNIYRDQTTFVRFNTGIISNRKIFDLNTQYDASLSKNGLYVNDQKILSVNQSSFSDDGYTMSVFAFRNSTTGDIISYGKIKLYSFFIKENDVIIRNFIPCYTTTTVTDVDGKTCPSGTIGLYDLVEDQFYTNQGTGEFLKGEDD